jgi:short-subunit dehydrogenase
MGHLSVPLAVVTGASSGIGAELARELARRGNPVLAVARRRDRLQALADEASRLGWGTIHPFSADLAEPGAVKAIATQARKLRRDGLIGWVVNNAGLGAYGPFQKQDPERITQMVRVNCEAVVGLTHALLPDLLEAGAGKVLNVGSVAGFMPTSYVAVYGATKAFVLSFSEALHEELRGTGVTVTALCPGPVSTEFGEVAGTRARPRHLPGRISAETCARQGIDAAERGEVVYVPGMTSRALVLTSAIIPRPWVRRLSGWFSRPGSA